MHNTTERRPRRPLGRVAGAVLVTAAAAAAVAGVGVTTASASTSSTTVTEAFRYTIKPFDSITVSSMSCPSGSWLLNKDLSPGRYVPLGVQVVEPGLIGVTITGTVNDEARGNGDSAPITGTKSNLGISTATNWDPFGSRELVIKLHCTTDLSKAAHEPILNVG